MAVDWDKQMGFDNFDDGDETDEDHETVRERIVTVLDADEIHGLTVTRRSGDTIYCVVSSTRSVDKVSDLDMSFPVLDLRTVVVDLEDDAVTVSDNGLWVPHEAEVGDSLTQMLARTTTDLSNGEADDAPALKSAVADVDPELFLGREIEVRDAIAGQDVGKMENHGGISPARAWGYGAGPPPEVDYVVERLEEAGLDSAEHFIRLVWGKKEPMERRSSPTSPDERPVDELTGNYGIELLPRDSGLVAIDVDYPEAFPEDVELPETLEVSSPHGDDTQRHIILRCDEKGKVANGITPPGQSGAWAVQSIEWGDLWIGDRYLVGPGSQLSEFGCDDGDHTRGDRGGCEACEDENSGYYEVVSDAPIATVEPDVILDLLAVSEGYSLRNGRADNDPPEPEGEDEDAESGISCDNCGKRYDDVEDLKALTVGDSTRYICRGGCDA